MPPEPSTERDYQYAVVRKGVAATAQWILELEAENRALAEENTRLRGLIAASEQARLIAELSEENERLRAVLAASSAEYIVGPSPEPLAPPEPQEPSNER